VCWDRNLLTQQPTAQNIVLNLPAVIVHKVYDLFGDLLLSSSQHLVGDGLVKYTMIEEEEGFLNSSKTKLSALFLSSVLTTTSLYHIMISAFGNDSHESIRVALLGFGGFGVFNVTIVA